MSIILFKNKFDLFFKNYFTIYIELDFNFSIFSLKIILILLFYEKHNDKPNQNIYVFFNKFVLTEKSIFLSITLRKK